MKRKLKPTPFIPVQPSKKPAVGVREITCVLLINFRESGKIVVDYTSVMHRASQDVRRDLRNTSALFLVGKCIHIAPVHSGLICVVSVQIRIACSSPSILLGQ